MPRPPVSVSWAWWLVPIFFGTLGGIIAFFAVLKRKPVLAIAMLIIGIVRDVILYIWVRNAINSMTDFGLSCEY